MICGCLFALWCFLLTMFSMLLKSNIDTDELSTSLWIFFFLFVLSAFLTGAAISVGQRERAKREADEAALLAAAEDGEEHYDDDDAKDTPYRDQGLSGNVNVGSHEEEKHSSSSALALNGQETTL